MDLGLGGQRSDNTVLLPRYKVGKAWRLSLNPVIQRFVKWVTSTYQSCREKDLTDVVTHIVTMEG